MQETSQGNPLCSYLYFKLAKMSCFFFSFFFCKVRKQEGRTGPAQWGGLTLVEGEKWWGKEVGK
jgi:hypothetical protein